MKIGIERLRNCVIFWIDVDVGPVGPSMFHTRRSATKSNKYLREELLCGLLWAAQIRFDTRHYKPLNLQPFCLPQGSGVTCLARLKSNMISQIVVTTCHWSMLRYHAKPCCSHRLTHVFHSQSNFVKLSCSPIPSEPWVLTSGAESGKSLHPAAWLREWPQPF